MVAEKRQWPTFEEGPCENALTVLGDGSLLSVMRIDGGDGKPHMQHKPLLQARSHDKAKSWQASLMADPIRASRPRLITMPSGPVALLTIRPSIMLWISVRPALPEALRAATPDRLPLWRRPTASAPTGRGTTWPRRTTAR